MEHGSAVCLRALSHPNICTVYGTFCSMKVSEYRLDRVSTHTVFRLHLFIPRWTRSYDPLQTSSHDTECCSRRTRRGDRIAESTTTFGHPPRSRHIYIPHVYRQSARRRPSKATRQTRGAVEKGSSRTEVNANSTVRPSPHILVTVLPCLEDAYLANHISLSHSLDGSILIYSLAFPSLLTHLFIVPVYQARTP